LLTGDIRGNINILEIQSSSSVKTLSGHVSEITGLQFFNQENIPNELYWVSASKEG